MHPSVRIRRSVLISGVAAQRDGIWDAFDQGRLAFLSGCSFGSNPHSLYAGYFHANVRDWERGWRHEAALG